MTDADRLRRVLCECEEIALNEGVQILVIATIDGGERCGISLPAGLALADRMLTSAALEVGEQSKRTGLV